MPATRRLEQHEKRFLGPEVAGHGRLVGQRRLVEPNAQAHVRIGR
jgi:hypothetical protein